MSTSTSRQLGRGLGIASLIALATAVTSRLIGTDRGVPQALIDSFRLGHRGQLAIHLSYDLAAGMAAAAAVGAFALRYKPAGWERRLTPSVPIVVTLAVVLMCFVAPDFAMGGGSPIGAYNTRGAYEFISAPELHPPIVRADVSRPGQFAKGYIFTADFYNPSLPGTLVGQSGPLIVDRRLSPVWFRPVPESAIAANLSLQTYEGRPVLAWWQGVINGDGLTTSGEYVVVDQHYRQVAQLRGADGWVLALHEIAIRGDNAWVTANKDIRMNLSSYGGARDGRVLDSAVQEYNLKTGKLLRSWDALHHIPLSDSRIPVPTNGSLWDAYHLNSIDVPSNGTFVVSMRSTWAAYQVNVATGAIDWTLGGMHSSFRFGSGASFQWQHDVTVYPGTPYVTVFDDACCQVTAAGKLVASGSIAGPRPQARSGDPRRNPRRPVHPGGELPLRVHGQHRATPRRQRVRRLGLPGAVLRVHRLRPDAARRGLARSGCHLSRHRRALGRVTAVSAKRCGTAARGEDDRLRELERCHGGGVLEGLGRIEQHRPGAVDHGTESRLRDHDRGPARLPRFPRAGA